LTASTSPDRSMNVFEGFWSVFWTANRMIGKR
jgi:hypothetical protein